MGLLFWGPPGTRWLTVGRIARIAHLTGRFPPGIPLLQVKTVFNMTAQDGKDGKRRGAAPERSDAMWTQLQRYLDLKGLRTTGQRRAIVEAFLKAKAHLSVEDLLSLVRKIDPRVGYATVYRTLKLLAESGLAHERNFDGLTRYEVAAGVHHHDHLICVACGEITEFEESRIERLQDDVARRHGFDLVSHKHELYGRCSRCRSRRRRGRGGRAN